MQFKRQGNKIQILAYTGYNKEKRRGMVDMIGSLDVRGFAPSVGLMDKLTDEQKEEVQAYIETERQKNAKQDHRIFASVAASTIRRIIEGIDAGESGDAAWAAEVWAAMDTLGKSLRKAGHPKPARPKKQKPATEAPGQTQLPAV